MDSQALQELHVTLKAQGFTGQLEQLLAMLSQADADTTERRVLAWWKGQQTHRQHAALVAAYAHAHKHGTHISTFDSPERASLVLTRSRDFPGVTLGRVEVDMREIRWCFYHDNKFVGDRSVQL